MKATVIHNIGSVADLVDFRNYDSVEKTEKYRYYTYNNQKTARQSAFDAAKELISHLSIDVSFEWRYDALRIDGKTVIEIF